MILLIILDKVVTTNKPNKGRVNMNTDVVTAKLVDLDVREDGFYASFDRDVLDLEHGDDIYLQLPDCTDSQHDTQYDDETHQACIKIIKEKYSDEDLSIMGIIKSNNLSKCEIRSCKLKTFFMDNSSISGKDHEGTYNCDILFNGTDDYYVVEESGIHKYYTNNFAWRINTDGSERFDDDELLNAFKSSSNTVYSGNLVCNG